MIEEQAKVIAIDNDQVLLEAQSQSSCNACAARQGCGTSVLSKWVGRKFTRFKAPNTVNARVGEVVVVGLAEDALLKGSLLVYLLPLIGMIIFALVADSLIAAETASRDLLVVLAAVLGFFVASFVSRVVLSSGALMGKLAPVIVRKNIAGR